MVMRPPRSNFTATLCSSTTRFRATSTSIAAALGFAVANKLADRPGKAIAVIGDGAMSAGMAYEAMNNAEQAGNRLIVILNDNDMSIAPPVGGLSARSEEHTSELQSLMRISYAVFCLKNKKQIVSKKTLANQTYNSIAY